jgi:hypothetical protein
MQKNAGEPADKFPANPRMPGAMAGEIWIAPDFDLLPSDIAEAFGSKPIPDEA